MFKNGDMIVVTNDEGSRFYSDGAKGVVIRDTAQESLLVQFHTGVFNTECDGRWYINAKNIELMEVETLQSEFDKWIADNPHFWDMFVLFTNQLIACGATKSSAWLVCNRIRWETAIKTHGNPYKISNDFIALLARKFMVEFPQHAGFFTIKAMKRK